MKTAILFLLFAVFTRTAALSCSCSPRPPVADAFSEAQAVFAGRCISGKLVVKHDKEAGDFSVCQFTFEVTRTWKGTANKKQIMVETGLGWGCGYTFEVGASYIVYCYDAGGGFWTNICTRTCIADFEPRAETEMKELDAAKAKTK